MRTVKMNDYKRKWNNTTRRWVYEHREVAAQKIGRKLFSHEQVHHIDGDIQNNTPENLYIGTNATHCKIHNPAKYRRKLTEENVVLIRQLRKAGKLLTEIAKIFNVEQSTISRICSGERW